MLTNRQKYAKEYNKNKQKKKTVLAIIDASSTALIIARDAYDRKMNHTHAKETEIIKLGTHFFEAGVAYKDAGMPNANDGTVASAYSEWEDYCEVTDNNKKPTLPMRLHEVEELLKGSEAAKQEKRRKAALYQRIKYDAAKDKKNLQASYKKHFGEDLEGGL